MRSGTLTVKTTVLCLGVSMVVCDVLGCRRTGDADTSDESRSARRTADIDRLRALPYVGAVENEAEEYADQDGVIMYDPARSCPGYSLYTVFRLCTADLIDAEGNVVRSWSHTGHNWVHAELLSDGDLLVVGADLPVGPHEFPTNRDRYLLRFDWEGELLWKRQVAVHHDVESRPAGRLLTLTFQRRRIPAIHPRFDARGDWITLLADDGAVLERIGLYDVVSAKPQMFPLLKVRPQHASSGRWVDVFHANSVERAHHEHLEGKHAIYDPACILVCLRNQNRVAIINWDQEELLWAWGKDKLDGPHDAQYLANGNILVFDNGLGRGWSRVIEVDPLTRRIVWQYRAPQPEDFYSMSKGSAQRLPNGNTLIANSDSGLAFEVTPAGAQVWKFLCPQRDPRGRRAAIVRVRRYEKTFIEELQGRYGSGAGRSAGGP